LIKSKTDALNTKDQTSKITTQRKLLPDKVKAAVLDLLSVEYDYASRLNSVLIRLTSKFDLNCEILFDCLDFNKRGQLNENK
jgi:hypothetical protein